MLIPYFENGKWGYLDEDKKVIVSPKYEEAELFRIFLGKDYQKYARVKKGTKFGVIDQSGEIIIPIKFDSIENNSLSTSIGGIGILYQKSNRYYYNEKGDISNEIKGAVHLICGNGLGSKCLVTSKKIGEKIMYEYVEITRTEREWLKDKFRVEVDSVITINNGAGEIIYRSDKKIVISNLLGNEKKSYNLCSEYLYDEVKFFDCEEIKLFNNYEPIISVKRDGKWGLVELSQSQTMKWNRELNIRELVEVKYEQIIEKIGKLYLVEYEKGVYGYVRLTKGEVKEYW
jgi:hypothetical protein